MPMTVVVTRDVAQRSRGFLASCMLEIAPGVYSAPSMSPAVRERVWTVLTGWFAELAGGSVVMLWADARLPGGQGISVLGSPAKELVEVDDHVLTRRPVPLPDSPSRGAPTGGRVRRSVPSE